MAITLITIGTLIDTTTDTAAPLTGIAIDTAADLATVLDAIDARTPAAALFLPAATDTDPDPFDLFTITDADRAQAAAYYAAEDARHDAAEAQIAAFLADLSEGDPDDSGSYDWGE